MPDIIDKSWVRLDRNTEEYQTCLCHFLDHSFEHVAIGKRVKCPCRLCYNRFWRNRTDIYNHMIVDGMDTRYMDLPWKNHGETILNPTIDQIEQSELSPLHDDHTGPDMHCLLDDLFRNANIEIVEDNNTNPQSNAGCTVEAERFFNFVRDADAPLWPGCESMKKLQFIVELYHIKCLHGWTDRGVSDLLSLLKRSFPEGETLPATFYHTRKLISDLGLSYVKIDACRNDCMLYFNDRAADIVCRECGADRYTEESSLNGRKVAAKVLRYFPLVPRLQRLFMSRHTADHMTWHATSRVNDGVMRHPADSPAWLELDTRYPEFASDPRNVRLGLASDGFNPFGHMSSAHSTWPVVMSIYNLPPWMCMKKPNLFMSLLIPGPKAPGNDIDIYLEPLVEELGKLWESGVQTYDVAKSESFNMRAALLWTINDFPAYANLSGWSTKGKFACPQCHGLTESQYLSKGHKHCYLGHRRFLPTNHRFRRERCAFNGEGERRTPPVPLSGSDCLDELSTISFKFGKKQRKPVARKRMRDGTLIEYSGPWKKQSIFFKLPYWKYNLLRHNLDVMHIEKNVCDSLVGTLLGLDGKNKDGINARADLELLQLKPNLHPVRCGSKTYLPPAAFTLNKQEKEMFCQVLKTVKIPDGYSSNIARCIYVKERKIMGLKSHDCHVLLQHLVPLAVRRVLPKGVTSIILELCSFFKNVCAKSATKDDFLALNLRITLTLCQLERIMPPAFFDVMVHLPIHLANEAAIGGPVQYRWMYPIERYLQTLKNYVRNKSRPEGSIAEGYLVDECLSFCSMYLKDVDTRRNRVGRNTYDGENIVREGFAIFHGQGESRGAGVAFYMDHALWERTHRCTLFNCHEVDSYVREHRAAVRATRSRRTTQYEADCQADNSFTTYFKDHIKQLLDSGEQIPADLVALSIGPSQWAVRYKSFVVNGFRFRIKEVDVRKKNQNSGVFVVADTNSYASARDRNPRIGPVGYYGVLINIIELHYTDDQKVVLFDCEWADTTTGVKTDEFGFKLVNFDKLMETTDTFVPASNALQVFYVPDPIDSVWQVAVKTQPRDMYDMNTVNAGDICVDQRLDVGVEESSIQPRVDIEGTTIDRPLSPLSATL